MAHCNRESFFDIVECTQGKNIVVSHTCFDDVFRHVRNLNTAQCKAVVEANGLVGLTLVRDFLGGDCLNRVVAHIDWFASKFGCDCLSVGSDFFGTRALHGLNSYGDFGVIGDKLLKMGFAQGDIDKIFFQNLKKYIARHK